MLKTTVPPPPQQELKVIYLVGAKQALFSDGWFSQKGGVIVFNQPQNMAT